MVNLLKRLRFLDLRLSDFAKKKEDVVSGAVWIYIILVLFDMVGIFSSLNIENIYYVISKILFIVIALWMVLFIDNLKGLVSTFTVTLIIFLGVSYIWNTGTYTLSTLSIVMGLPTLLFEVFLFVKIIFHVLFEAFL